MAQIMQHGIVQPVARARRKLRHPQHTFYLKSVPFVLQPFFIAPVLPGETLKTLLMQARVVTDPIKNPLIGWWCEFYFFYVKLRDLYERDELTQMILNPSWSPTNVTTAQGGTTASIQDFYGGGAGQINYVELCRRRVIDEYFRDEGDTYNTAGTTVVEGGETVSLAAYNHNNVLDSLRTAAAATAVDVEVEGPDANSTIQASEIAIAMRTYEMLRAGGLSTMSFEDYLTMHGIRAPATELHRPELVRYVRDWSYPTNTIDPTNGTPRSAVSWSPSERADKDRFFNEPGFLFGIHLTRPKVYLSRQQGSFTSVMNDVLSWLPALMDADPQASFKKIADVAGPLGDVTDANGYWVDIKDLLMYGEQFVNVSNAATDQNYVPSPGLSLTRVSTAYPPSLAAIQDLFVDAAGGKYKVRCDGVVNLSIASSIRDTSPRGGTGEST